jgi:hypothetical protein
LNGDLDICIARDLPLVCRRFNRLAETGLKTVGATLPWRGILRATCWHAGRITAERIFVQHLFGVQLSRSPQKMTNRAQLNNLLAAKPFRPFWLETTGGNQIKVAKPAWFFQPAPDGYSFVVFNDDSTYTVLNYADLTDNIVIEGPPA